MMLILTIVITMAIAAEAIVPCPTIHTDSPDPCTIATEFPADDRLFNNTNNLTNCDDGMQEGWYKFTVGGQPSEIPSVCVKHQRCGTILPLRLNLPNGSPPVNTTYCVESCSSYEVLGKWDCCVLRQRALIRNCSGYYVYHLQPADRCPVAYCAQVSSTRPASISTAKTGEHVSPEERLDTTNLTSSTDATTATSADATTTLSSTDATTTLSSTDATTTLSSTDATTTLSSTDATTTPSTNVTMAASTDSSTASSTDINTVSSVDTTIAPTQEGVTQSVCASLIGPCEQNATRRCCQNIYNVTMVECRSMPGVFGGMCDNFPDCADRSDETDDICYQQTCQEGQIACPDGSSGCVIRCDGTIDCDDGSDENGCPLTTTIVALHLNLTGYDNTQEKLLNNETFANDLRTAMLGVLKKMAPTSVNNSLTVQNIIARNQSATVDCAINSTMQRAALEAVFHNKTVVDALLETLFGSKEPNATMDTSTDEDRHQETTTQVLQDTTLTSTTDGTSDIDLENVTELGNTTEMSTQETVSTNSSQSVVDLTTTVSVTVVTTDSVVVSASEGSSEGTNSTLSYNDTTTDGTVKSTAEPSETSGATDQTTADEMTDDVTTTPQTMAITNSSETAGTASSSSPQSTESITISGAPIDISTEDDLAVTMEMTGTVSVTEVTQVVTSVAMSTTGYVGPITAMQPTTDDMDDGLTTDLPVVTSQSGETSSSEPVTSSPSTAAVTTATGAGATTLATAEETTPPLEDMTSAGIALSTAVTTDSVSTQETHIGVTSLDTSTYRETVKQTSILSTTLRTSTKTYTDVADTDSPPPVTGADMPVDTTDIAEPDNTTDIQNRTTPETVQPDDFASLIENNAGLFIFLVVLACIVFSVCVFGIIGYLYINRLRSWSPKMAYQDAYSNMEKKTLAKTKASPEMAQDNPIPDVDILEDEKPKEQETSLSRVSTLECPRTPANGSATSNHGDEVPLTAANGAPATIDVNSSPYGNHDADGVVPIDELDKMYPFPWIESADDTKL